MLSDERTADFGVADPVATGFVGRRCLPREVYRLAIPQSQMSSFTTLQIIALCFSAFGIGYACGSIQRIARRAIETLD
nr:hypothetical protein [uncultured Duganella sp.]